MQSPTSSIFDGGRGIKTESLAGHGNVGEQGPGLVPGFLKGARVGQAHLWMAQMGLPYRPEALVLAPTPGPCDCHHTALMSYPSPTPPCPLSAAQRGLGLCGPYLYIFLSGLPLVTPCCPWPAPAAQATLRASGEAPSGSSPWKFVLQVLGFPDEEV